MPSTQTQYLAVPRLHMCVAAQCQFAANSSTRFAVVYIGELYTLALMAVVGLTFVPPQDTEGGFVVDRIAAIAEAMVEHRPDLKSRGVVRPLLGARQVSPSLQ
jgi:hypothetical protein